MRLSLDSVIGLCDDGRSAVVATDEQLESIKVIELTESQFTEIKEQLIRHENNDESVDIEEGIAA